MEHSKFNKSFVDGVLTYKPPITEGLGKALSKVSDTINKMDAGAKRINQLAKQGGDTALIHLFGSKETYLDELEKCRDRGDKWFEFKGKRYPCDGPGKDVAKKTQGQQAAPVTPQQQTASAAPTPPVKAPSTPTQIKKPPAPQPIKYPQP